MAQNEKRYEYMKIKQAENGWVLCYDEMEKNPMMPESTYGHSYSEIEKKEVFETGDGVTMEQALDKALARQKEFLMMNMK